MKVKRTMVAVLLAGTALVGATTAPAEAANALCPKTCLTGGVLGLGATRATIQATQTRTYHFSWNAIDLTELPPIQENLSITLRASGSVVNGVFTATNGTAEIVSEQYQYEYVDRLTVRDTGVFINANGGNSVETFQLQSTIVGGGQAKYQSTFDHDWDCGDCST